MTMNLTQKQRTGESRHEDTMIDDKPLQSRTAYQNYLHDHLQRMHNEIESTTRKLELEKRRLNKLELDCERTRTEREEKLRSSRKQQIEAIKGDCPKCHTAAWWDNGEKERSTTATKSGCCDRCQGKREGEKGESLERCRNCNYGICRKCLYRPQAAVSTKKLEHRLSKAISQLNVLGHENNDAREKINQIRRERLQMNQVFKKLQVDIKENICGVTSLQKDTDGARRDHEDRGHRMNALKRQVEIERRQFKQTVQKLQKDMKDREREELIQRVALVKESLKLSDEDKSMKSRGLKADEEEHFQSTLVMRRILKLAFLNAIQRRHIRQHQKTIEVFEQAFATIKSTTGISDIEEIVKIFLSLEQRNFSLLTYVNELNRMIESFEKNNRDLDEQLQTQKRSEADCEQRRTDILAELKTQISSTAAVIDDNTRDAREQQDILDRCKPLIQHILKTVEKENRGFGGQSAQEASGDNTLAWLTYIEKTLTQWKDFLPETKDTRHCRVPNRTYRYTVGNQVLALQPKRHHHAAPQLVKPGELPSASNVFLEQGAAGGRGPNPVREEDSDTDEEDMQNHPWTRQELRDKAIQSVAKRKKHRKTESTQPATSNIEQQRPGDSDAAAMSASIGGGAAGGGEPGAAEIGFDEMVKGEKEADEDSAGSDESDIDDDAGPTDEEINEIFLKRYKMSREELQGMADKMGIQLNNLCYLKQEFDAYDEDRSGYIDVKELKELLAKLGEELSEEELDQAFRELDSDGSGEIEFFEFVEWFTSED